MKMKSDIEGQTDNLSESQLQKLKSMSPEKRKSFLHALGQIDEEERGEVDDMGLEDEHDELNMKDPTGLAGANRDFDSSQGTGGSRAKAPGHGDRRHRSSASRNQGIWKSARQATKEDRPYSVVKAVRAAMAKDHKYARLETYVSDHLRELGFTGDDKSLLIPLNASWLELNPEYEGVNKGLFAMVNHAYRPSPTQSKLLRKARAMGVLDDKEAFVSDDGATYVRKALVSNDDGLGGFLVQTERSAEIIDLLRSRLAAQAAGVRDITMPQGGKLEITTKTKGSTTFRKRELETLTESNIEFGIQTLSAKTLTALVAASSQLLSRATPDVEAIIREDMVASIAEREDSDIFYGPGGTDDPQGIRNWKNITIVTPANGVDGDLSPEDTFEMETVIDENKAIFTAYVGAPRALQYIRQFRTGALQPSNDAPVFTVGGFMFQQSMDIAAGQPSLLNGYPFITSHTIKTDLGAGSDASEIFGGDFSEVWVGRGAVLEVSSNDSIGFLSNKVFFKAMLEDDVVVSHEEGIAVTDSFTMS